MLPARSAALWDPLLCLPPDSPLPPLLFALLRGEASLHGKLCTDWFMESPFPMLLGIPNHREHAKYEANG